MEKEKLIEIRLRHFPQDSENNRGLGKSRRLFAESIKVKPRRLKAWELGQNPVPVKIEKKLQKLEKK